MKIADLRIQTTAPNAPSVGVVGLYANVSGVPVTINSDGVISAVGGEILTTYPLTAVVSGGSSVIGTGAYWGPSVGAGLPSTGLGMPSKWIRMNVSGTNYAIPAYALR